MRACLAAAEEALDRAGTYEEHFALAGLQVSVRFAGERLRDQMTRAFVHVRSQAQIPALNVLVWDSLRSGVTLPPEVGPLTFHVRRGLGQVQQEGSVLSLFEGMDQGLSMLDSQSHRAIYWLPDAERLAEGDRAAPLRTILNWFLPGEGRTVVHAAALATRSGAVLLFGRSGSGKSTTALACIEAGFAYLGDDFCALTMDGDVTVHSLYCSGKVYERHLAELRAFAPLVTNMSALASEKAIGYLAGENGAVVEESARVCAVVMLTGKGAPEPRLQRIAPAKALLGVAPSTMLNLPGPAGSQLAGFAELVRRVPCYEMELAGDIRVNPEALRALLDGTE
jgi:hypothetical protein